MRQKSKFLAYILRHKPASANLVLSPEGWVDVAEVVKNTDLTLSDLVTIVETDAKGRYSFSGDMLQIRANQGHSAVSISFERAIPPAVLYHGTTREISAEILKTGLKKMNRHHVHLTSDLGTANTVGARRKKSVVIFVVDTEKMLADGVEFFKSDNGVWLVDFVPSRYLSILTT